MNEQQAKTVTVVKKRREGKVGMEVPVNEAGEVTWREVRKLFRKFDIPYSPGNTKAVHPRTKTEFTEDSAIVVGADETEGRVYLFPKDTKAGMNRSEMYATIKKHIEEFGETAKRYYTSPTHYTRTSNDELSKRIANSPYSIDAPGAVSEEGHDYLISTLNKQVERLQKENAELRARLEKYEGVQVQDDPILREYDELEKIFSSEYDEDESDYYDEEDEW